MSEYLKTKNMATRLGYSPDFLLKKREVAFFEGTHYFTKEKRIDWKVSKMTEWVENNDISEVAKDILAMVS